MLRSKTLWMLAGMGCLIFASVACREREPAPSHNRNLGEGNQYLLPTPSLEVGEELTGPRGLEIPDLSVAGDVGRQIDGGDGDDATGGGKGVISSFLDRLKGAVSPSAGVGKKPDTEEQ